MVPMEVSVPSFGFGSDALPILSPAGAGSVW